MSQTQSPEALLDALQSEGVVVIDEETDEVSTTEAFEADREVYYDTYVTMGDTEFHESVATCSASIRPPKRPSGSTNSTCRARSSPRS